MNTNPGERRATVTVALLCFLNAASFIDRMILALLMAPIRADLAVSDAQLALLFGLGFALCYVAVGVPLANIADRGNRKRLLLFGVITWSLTTFASAFTWDFRTLLLTRAGVAVGEAVLMPIAVSMIADLYPPARRALPTSIYLLVGALMSQGALIVGSGAVALAGLASGPLGLAPWRLTFILVALPGIVVAVFFAILVAEPPRGDAGERTGDRISLTAAARHLFDHAGIYLGTFLGIGFVVTVTVIMIAWIPTMLIREHGLSPAQAGLTYGLPALVGAIGGTLSVPPLLKRLESHSRARALLIVAIVDLAMVPAAALTVGSGSLTLVMIGTGIAVGGICGSSVLPPLLVQAVTPPRFRARLVAVYLTAMTLLSQGLGPSLVTTLAAHSPGTALSVNIARAIWLMLGMASIFVAIALASTRRRTGQLVPVDDWT